MQERESLQPIPGATRSWRQRLDLKDELVLALLPTLVILVLLGLVEALTRQRLLFASLASSAFLIYLDPQHGTNSVRTLVVSQLTAASLGLLTYTLLGPGYLAAGAAIVATIVSLILLDAVHPPAVSTSLSFAFRAGDESNWVIFALAVGITATLVGLERAALWLLATREQGKNDAPTRS
jgi:CBS-domain-containing membrane protein